MSMHAWRFACRTLAGRALLASSRAGAIRCSPGSRPFHNAAGPSSRPIVSIVPIRPLRGGRPRQLHHADDPLRPPIAFFTCICCHPFEAAGGPWRCPAATSGPAISQDAGGLSQRAPSPAQRDSRRWPTSAVHAAMADAQNMFTNGSGLPVEGGDIFEVAIGEMR